MKIIMIVLLLLISQHASGVEVYEGAESVLLPCQVSVGVSRNSTSAVWDRDGLSDKKVHLRRQKSDDPDEQHVLYQHRTSMRVDALQTGDLSLTLRNPTVSDSGTYTCTTVRYGDRLSQTEVQLKVSEPPPVWPKVLSAVLVTLIILAAAFALFAYKRMKDREALLPEVVDVPQGEESVLLPFKTTAGLPQDITVEWTLTEPKHMKDMKVHVYECGNNQPDKQDQGYRGRTEMDEDPLRNKDLSLTLKRLRLTDSGVYTCTVKKDDGHVLLQKVVTLSVRVPQPEMVEVIGARTVHLPFKTKADLPQDFTVEWTHNNMKIHVYESGKQRVKQDKVYRDRTEMDEDSIKDKDLNLTLKGLNPTDSGVYTCTVYNKDGYMLLQKSMQLRVKALKPEFFEVTQEESVLLPFKTTADLPQDVTVEWRRSDCNNMRVHVYESGNNQPDKQHQRYRGRTEMNKDPLNTKDLSLTLKDLRLTDRGVYICTVKKDDGHMLLQKSMQLRVKESQPEMLEVAQVKESVLLPFKITADLPVEVTVKWTHSDSKHTKVCVFQKSQSQAEEQDQGYRGRAEMDEDPLRNKNLSLTLKCPKPSDHGSYTCTVYNKDGHVLLQKLVILCVRALEQKVVTVTEGEESVLLPFKTPADLAQNVTVEWTHNNIKVHVYESGKNQPDKQDQGYRGRTEMNEDPLRNKDLSLTLKRLRLTDSGVYTCTVYNKDGEEPIQRVVTLSVRDLQPELVEVSQGEESFHLSFETTADLPQDVTVEWTHNNMKVHVYESGNNQPDKDQGYRGRTEMDEDPLRNKDLSLTLKHLRLTDSGVYTCTVYDKDGHKRLEKSVRLCVRDQEMEVVVTQGLRFVVLPFTIPHDLPRYITVEWRHNDVTVYKYMDAGENQPDKQHQGYRGRTEMDEDPRVNKDFSLTLRDLHLTDSGVYTCTVYDKYEYKLLQKSVTLGVRDLQPEVVEVSQGEESVHLSFETTADLPQDVTVEWTHNMKVHVYESGKHQPDKQDQCYRGRTEMDEDPLRTKDLSLTLKDLRLTDSGVYTCTVTKDGHMLLQKSVTLSVRATLKGTMAEMLLYYLCIRQRRVQRVQSDLRHRNRNHEDVPLMEVQSA